MEPEEYEFLVRGALESPIVRGDITDRSAAASPFLPPDDVGFEFDREMYVLILCYKIISNNHIHTKFET